MQFSLEAHVTVRQVSTVEHWKIIFFKNESNKLSRLLSMYLLCTVIREGFAHNRWLAAIQQHYIAKAESNDFASAM